MARIGETLLHGAVDGALELVGDEDSRRRDRSRRRAPWLPGRAGARPRPCGRRRRRRPCAAGRRRSGTAGAAEVRAGGFQRQVVDDALGLVERAVEAVDLVGGDDVGRHAALELAEALVVGVLEGLEGAHEVAEGGVEVVGGFGFEVVVCGSPWWGSSTRHPGRAAQGAATSRDLQRVLREVPDSLGEGLGFRDDGW